MIRKRKKSIDSTLGYKYTIQTTTFIRSARCRRFILSEWVNELFFDISLWDWNRHFEEIIQGCQGNRIMLGLDPSVWKE